MIILYFELKTYEGAFGQCPGNEAHGGSTFCAVATLLLTGRMYDVLDEFYVNRLVRWCVNRQDGGFNGRPNKETDTCYTFWVGATLRILGAHHMIDSEELVKFVFSTQHKVVGGFSKHCYTSPGTIKHLIFSFVSTRTIRSNSFASFSVTDPLHTYLGLSGLALIQKDIDLGVIPVNPELNITEKAERFWRVLPITTNLWWFHF